MPGGGHAAAARQMLSDIGLLCKGSVLKNNEKKPDSQSLLVILVE
jgi:hypothetical protein